MSAEPSVRGRPLWISRHGVLGFAHLPAGAGTIGVVFASPFGWEEMGSYPARRIWAETLAGSGIPVLRFDWPGAGDSAGLPADSGRLDAWCEAYNDSVDWLRAEAGVMRIATVGFGLGGLVAVEAIRRGAACEDLVLWPVHRDGRAYVRAERAFSRLQTGKQPKDDDVLPMGWIESGGYVLSPETIGALEPVRGWTDGPTSLERALLLDRDGSPVDAGVVDGLRSAGVEVQVAHGPGYLPMIEAPHRLRLPVEVIETVMRWLRSASPRGSGARRTVPTATELRLTGARERVLEVPCQRGTVFAIVTEPEQRDRRIPTLVLLSAWAERRSGPNRLWTEVARRTAAAGGVALRADLPGIGDALGDWGWLEFTINFHDPRIITEIRQLLGAASAAGLGERFILVGLSAGAYWSFRVLAADPRVVGALGINPRVELFAPRQQASEVSRKLHYVLRPGWWRRVIRREVQLSSMRVVALTALRVRLRNREGDAGANGRSSPLMNAFAAIGARGARLVLASTPVEGLEEALAAEGITARLRDWPRIRMVEMASIDHNVRPLRAQGEVHELVAELLHEATMDAQTPVSPVSASADQG